MYSARVQFRRWSCTNSHYQRESAKVEPCPEEHEARSDWSIAPYRNTSAAIRAECPWTAAAERTAGFRSEEHTSELQSLMRISYAVFCLKKKKHKQHIHPHHPTSYCQQSYNVP